MQFLEDPLDALSSGAEFIAQVSIAKDLILHGSPIGEAATGFGAKLRCPLEDINLIGYSRGGAAAVETAIEVAAADKTIRINVVGLIDPVDKGLAAKGADGKDQAITVGKLPNNVAHVWLGVRDKSRDIKRPDFFNVNESKLFPFLNIGKAPDKTYALRHGMPEGMNMGDDVNVQADLKKAAEDAGMVF